MSKNGYKSSTSRTQYFQTTKNSSHIQSSSRYETDLKDLDIDSDFFEDLNPDPNNKTIQQSIERSYEEKRNLNMKSKTIQKSEDGASNRNHTIKISKQIKNGKNSNRLSKNSNFKNEAERQKAIYLSPDLQSGSPFPSPLFKDKRKDSNDIEEMGYKTNYVFESKKINGKNVGMYSTNEKYEYITRKGKKESRYEKSNIGSPGNTEIISPVGYIDNSSGSENEDNQMKSFDNYNYSMRTNNINKYNKNKIIKKEKNKLNYELEDPERFDYLGKNERKISNDEIKNNSRYINRSQIRNKINESKSDIKDFESPDRNINQSKKFRNVNMRMIVSKGPSNDDRKVTKIITKEIVDISGVKDDKKIINKKIKINTKYSEDKNVRAKAAKIIQKWWRFNFKKDEEHDVAFKSAVKLQSFIRGFIVRKKVLRYITLAIYYQSFCDKLQDVLCNYVKTRIFKLFKEKKFNKINQKSAKTKNVYKNIYKIKKILISIFKKIRAKNILKYLKKWKIKANRIKIKTKKIEQKKIIVPKVNITSNNYRTNTKIMNLRKTQIKTIKNTTQTTKQQNISKKYYQNKTYNVTKKDLNNKRKTIEYPVSPRVNTTRFYHKIHSSPYRYSTSIETSRTTNRKSFYSPDTYRRENHYNYEYETNYQNNLNRSFDATYYSRNKEVIEYTTTDERSNYKRLNRYAKSKEKENQRNISPQFGTLKKNNTNTKTTNILNKKDYNTHTINVSSNIKRSKNIIKNTVKKYEVKNIRNQNSNTIKSTRRNEVISHINKPLRTIHYSESENIYTNKEKYKTKTINIPVNAIDNHLSISILNFPDEDKLNKTTVPDSEKEKIMIKEKTIIQKELPPETAEEGNNFQIFDMKISKRVSLFIEPTTELGKKIVDEEKELEIIKKREREKNNEIDKYKKDIETQKLKSLLDALRRSIRVAEGFKKRIIYKKFNQYRKNCSNNKGAFMLEIEPMDEFEINKILKEKKDSSVQMSPRAEKVVIKSFKKLKISEIPSISYLFKKKPKQQKITNSKLNIISKISKKDQGQQSESWNTEITNIQNDNIKIIGDKPIEKPRPENKMSEIKQVEILGKKKNMIDDEVQHEYEPNEIEGEELEFLSIRPEYKESTSQYDIIKPEISKGENLNIMGKKKKVKKVETKDGYCNAVVNTTEEGINAVEKVKEKPKNIEVQIRTVKRSLVKMEIPILKKLWLRKAFTTFRENCNRPPFHLILERELLRMAFLRWRFVRGYGPDRYGNAYDRDGNFLYKVKGKVADCEIQNEQIVEQDEQGTQYVPIQNIISTLKQIEFGPSYKKPEKKQMKDASVGNNIRMEEAIEAMDSFKIKQKKKKVNNQITNDNFGIIKKMKKFKNQETQMPKIKNIIDKLENIKITNEEFITNKKNSSRLKDLLTQLVYRKIITDKLDLSEALRNWLKQTIILSHIEETELENERRRQTKIKRNDRFSLIEKISKEESSTQVVIPKNKIENTLNLNLVKKIKKKNAEINVNLPSQFDLDKIEPKKENKILFKSTKKPLVLKANKENEMNIYSEDYIFKEEIKRGIHHQMTEVARKRVTEILANFIISRGDPISLLRKYFTIWNRKVKYLSLIENARIISEFCKRNLNNLLTRRKWEKLSEKLLFKERVKIIKLSKEITIRINKMFDLIRITRVNTVFSKKKFLHYILIAWLAYTRTINQKRNNVKVIYENMLSTYMNLADDVFGSNQKENPSVQDALFEAVDSNKFQTKDIQDVPLAQRYYEKKKSLSKNKKITFYSKEDNKDKVFSIKKYTTYKVVSNDSPISSSVKAFINKNNNTKEDNSKEKKINIKDEDRLHSFGRGRAYRTEFEKNIINKYNINNKFFDNKNDKRSEVDNEKGNKNIMQGNIKIVKRSYEEEIKGENKADENNNFFNDEKKRELRKMRYLERRKFFKNKLTEN